MDSRDLLVAGETLVDLFPAPEDTAPAERDTLRRRAGGAPANVAAGLAALDSPPWFWTSVGDDAFGTFLESTLADAGVPSRFVFRRENAATGLALVDETVAGGFELYVDGTATVAYDIEELPDELFADLGWIHLGGVLFAHEPARSAMFTLLDRAQTHDCTVSFDPNTRPSVWPSTDACAETLETVLPDVDIVVAHTDDFPTERFADNATALADDLLQRAVSMAVITAGADGAELKTREGSDWGAQHHRHPGFEVDVVDTTGAGDAFTAATIAGLRDDDTPLDEVLREANATGALATTETGGIAALPDRSTVTSWLERRDSLPE